MNNFVNPFNNGAFPGMNINNQNQMDKEQSCSCNNLQQNNSDCMSCPTTYKCCPPIVTCSKKVIDQYHVTKQPYVHNYHTEIVHHYVTENEFIPNYSCSEVHVNEPNNSNYPR